MNNQQNATLFRGPVVAADDSYVQGERPDLNMLFNAHGKLTDIAFDENKPLAGPQGKIYKRFLLDIQTDFIRVVFDFLPVPQDEVFMQPEDVFRECLLTINETEWSADEKETVGQIKGLLMNMSVGRS